MKDYGSRVRMLEHKTGIKKPIIFVLYGHYTLERSIKNKATFVKHGNATGIVVINGGAHAESSEGLELLKDNGYEIIYHPAKSLEGITV